MSTAAQSRLPGFPKNAWGSSVLRLGLFACLYLAAVRLGLVFVFPGQGIAAIWPASGFALAGLLLARPGERLFYLGVIGLVNLASNLAAGNSLWISAGYGVANTLEPALGVWLMGRLCQGKVDFIRLRDVMVLVLVAGPANGLTAGLGALVPMLGFGASYPVVWAMWFFEDGLGILTVTPLIIALSAGGIFFEEDSHFRRFEAAAWTILLCGLTWLIFGVQPVLFGFAYRPSIVFPLLLWGAFRFGPRFLALGQAIFAAVALVATLSGQSSFPLGGQTDLDRLNALQVFLSITSVSSLILAAILSERWRANAALRESEERLRLALRAAPGSVFSQDRELRYTWMLNFDQGVDPMQVIGKTDSDIYAPEPATRLTSLKRAALAGNPVREEVSLIRQGHPYTYDMVIEPLHNSAGQVTGISGVTWDISPQKRVQHALQASEERYRILVETIDTGIFMSNLEGKLLEANPAMARMAGYANVEEMLASPSLRLYSEMNDRVQVLSELAQHGFIKNLELRARRKDGSQQWISLSAVWLSESNGTPGSLFGSITDITERKQADENLLGALTEKEVLLRELYHRTKNNMQVIQGILVLQGESFKDPGARQMLAEVASKIQGMALVHEMLYRSQNLSQIDLMEYIQNLIPLLQQQVAAFSSRVTFHLDLESHLVPIEIAMPCGLLINELISNAFKHAFPGGNSGEIRLRVCRENDQRLLLEVSDNGVGFPPGFNPRESDSVGVQTIIALSELQLQGQVDFISPPGLTCQVRFDDSFSSQ